MQDSGHLTGEAAGAPITQKKAAPAASGPFLPSADELLALRAGRSPGVCAALCSADGASTLALAHRVLTSPAPCGILTASQNTTGLCAGWPSVPCRHSDPLPHCNPSQGSTEAALQISVARRSVLADAGLRKTGAATVPEAAATEQATGPPAAIAGKGGNAKKRKSVRFNIPTKGARSPLTTALFELRQLLTQKSLVERDSSTSNAGVSVIPCWFVLDVGSIA